MTTTQRKHVMKAIVPLLVLALSAGAMSACSDDNSDTASTEPTVEEAPTPTEAAVDEALTPTAAEEPATLTAETTGTLWTLGGAEAWEGSSGQQLFASVERIEVTMEDGSVRSVPTDEETLNVIWPDGTTAAGVLVVIEEVDGGQRITGPAE